MHIPTDYIYICGERSAEGGREPVGDFDFGCARDIIDGRLDD